MFITEQLSKKKHYVVVEPIATSDYGAISKRRYFFDWRTKKRYDIYKLRIAGSHDILGLISIIDINSEHRIEINLLAVSKENRGRAKKYERICGTLIAFACRESVRKFGTDACVSLTPKTKLKQHYMSLYGMVDAGKQVFLQGESILTILNTYDI